ncbi:MAG TPA: hypothetical protein VIL35_06425 [Vicinamibacterales bacterium]
MPFRSLTPFAITAVLVTLAAGTVQAQTREPDRRASFTAGASLGDGDTALALSAGLGFRLSSRLSLDIEAAYARRLDFTLDLCPPPLVCILGGQVPVTGRTVSLVPHLTVELVPRSRSTRVYLLAGVGGGHIRQRHLSGPAVAGFPSPPVELTRSSRVVAISWGGGATVPVGRGFAAGVDVRVLHLLDEESPPERFIQPSGALETARIGARVEYRF